MTLMAFMSVIIVMNGDAVCVSPGDVESFGSECSLSVH